MMLEDIIGSSPVRTANLQSKIRKSSDSQQNQGFFRFRAEAEYSVSTKFVRCKFRVLFLGTIKKYLKCIILH